MHQSLRLLTVSGTSMCLIALREHHCAICTCLFNRLRSPGPPFLIALREHCCAFCTSHFICLRSPGPNFVKSLSGSSFFFCISYPQSPQSHSYSSNILSEFIVAALMKTKHPLTTAFVLTNHFGNCLRYPILVATVVLSTLYSGRSGRD